MQPESSVLTRGLPGAAGTALRSCSIAAGATLPNLHSSMGVPPVMTGKSKRARIEGLWVAPEFSLSRRTSPRLMPLPSSRTGLLRRQDSAQETSMARILELADIALSKKKRN